MAGLCSICNCSSRLPKSANTSGAGFCELYDNCSARKALSDVDFDYNISISDTATIKDSDGSLKQNNQLQETIEKLSLENEEQKILIEYYEKYIKFLEKRLGKVAK